LSSLCYKDESDGISTFASDSEEREEDEEAEEALPLL